ncbi:alpha/beta fold hydrolase [Chloroflexota bacterium]
METGDQPKEKWFNDGELRLHYLDWGNPGATPMLLVHGQSGNARNWDFFARSMNREYHVLALDQRGHGDSCWAGNYMIPEYVADLTKLVDNLELKDIVLIGHSLGGVNSIIYAAAHPDRVARLIIVDIGPEINTIGIEQMQKRIAEEPVDFSTEEEAAIQMKKEHAYYSADYIQHTVKYNIRRDESGRLVYKYDPAVRRARPGALDFLWKDLEEIVCPTLVVRGNESELLLPDVARRMVETLPFGSAVEIERATHTIPGDNPKMFESVVKQFLNSCNA